MDSLWQGALVGQQGIVALSSAFNTFHFLGYRSATRRRRWGAMALVLVNLTLLLESLYLGLLPQLLDLDVVTILLEPRLRFTLGFSPLAASVLISTFVIRQRANGRR